PMRGHPLPCPPARAPTKILLTPPPVRGPPLPPSRPPPPFPPPEPPPPPQTPRRASPLRGPPLDVLRADIPPEGTALGAVQVPGDGLPIVLGPDRPVTGGYPKVATVLPADLPLLAHAPPGARAPLPEGPP